MSQEPIISSCDALSLFQPKILATIDYIRNVDKQLPDAEAIYKYISRKEASNIKKTDIVNGIDELVKQNELVFFFVDGSQQKKAIQTMTHLFHTKII